MPPDPYYRSPIAQFVTECYRIFTNHQLVIDDRLNVEARREPDMGLLRVQPGMPFIRYHQMLSQAVFAELFGPEYAPDVPVLDSATRRLIDPADRGVILPLPRAR